MRKVPSNQNLEAGQDSFLDVVSNIVGILIILVVVIGAQVKHGLMHAKQEAREHSAQTETQELPPLEMDVAVPAVAPAKPSVAVGNEAKILEKQKALDAKAKQLAGLETKLRDAQAQTDKVQAEMLDLDMQQQRLDAESSVLLAERAQLGTYLEAVRLQMESLQSEEDVKKRELLQLHTKRLEQEELLKKLKTRQDALAAAAKNGGPKMIEHKETPIIRTVDTQEFHFIVQDSCVLFVPLDILLKEYERKIQQVSSSLLATGKRTDIIGPMDGFSLYAEAKLSGQQLAVFWKLQTPSVQEQGETLTRALRPDSRFQHYLSKLEAGKDVLTFWIYPSGFDTFLELKKAASRQGFAIASRPLPEGTPIAGSPFGQQSVAQ